MKWKQIKLGDLFEQYRIQHIVQDDTEYGQITISKNGYIKFRTSKIGKNIGRKRQFIINLKKFPNTLLFTRQGVAEGAIAFAPNEIDGCIATENMPMFSLKEGISEKFVNLLLKSEQYKQAVKKLIPTGSAQKSIHERDLMKISLFIPNEEEQKRLSELTEVSLNSIKVLNTEIEKQQILLKKLRQSILQEAIEGKLTASWRKENPHVESASVLLEKIKAEKEELLIAKKIKKQKPLESIDESETPFDIPDGWIWCRTNDICSSISSGSTPSKDNFISSKGIPYLKVYNIREQKINLDYKPQYIKEEIHNTKLKRSILYPMDIVMNIVGPPLGKIAIVPDSHLEWNCNQAIVHFKLLEPKIHKYLYYFLRELSFLKYIHFKGVAGQDNISITQSRSIVFPLAPLKEQKQIVKKIESLFQICDKLEEQIKNSKSYSETLMQSVLKEAFEEKELTEELSVDESAMVSMAYIIDSIDNPRDLGRVKFQKMLYMHSAINNVDYGFDFKKCAMGPYDKKRMEELEKKIQNAQWFKKEKEEGKKGLVYYVPLSKRNEYKNSLNRLEKLDELKDMVTLMKPLSLRKAEVVATLHAVWNEEEKSCGFRPLAEVVIERAKKWHENKKDISADDWKWGVSWLREQKFLEN